MLLSSSDGLESDRNFFDQLTGTYLDIQNEMSKVFMIFCNNSAE